MINLSDLSPFTATEDAMRPASPERRCFYCRCAVGGRHRWDCVLVSRRIRIRAIFDFPDGKASVELEDRTAWKFDQQHIEFAYNDGSWCCDNLVHHLRELPEHRKLAAQILRYARKHGCTCGICHVDVVTMGQEPFLHER